MIRINDTFSAVKYIRGWELHRKYPSGTFQGKKSKKEFLVDVTFYPTFDLLLNAVSDKSVGEVEGLDEIRGMLSELRAEMAAAIKEVPNE